MKHLMSIGLITALASIAPPQAIAQDHRLGLEVQANTIVKQFAGKLKPKLKQAIQSGGFEHAINVCAKEAPAIAKQLSEETGWSVKRVSLKPRNPNAEPNHFERKVLTAFDARQKLGEPVSQLTYSVKDNEGFHFMKAQPVEAVCLNCHGTNIALNIKQALAKHYPNDIATGYSLGEVRGAFSLMKAFINKDE